MKNLYNNNMAAANKKIGLISMDNELDPGKMYYVAYSNCSTKYFLNCDKETARGYAKMYYDLVNYAALDRPFSFDIVQTRLLEQGESVMLLNVIKLLDGSRIAEILVEESICYIGDAFFYCFNKHCESTTLDQSDL